MQPGSFVRGYFPQVTSLRSPPDLCPLVLPPAPPPTPPSSKAEEEKGRSRALCIAYPARVRSRLGRSTVARMTRINNDSHNEVRTPCDSLHHTHLESFYPPTHLLCPSNLPTASPRAAEDPEAVSFGRFPHGVMPQVRLFGASPMPHSLVRQAVQIGWMELFLALSRPQPPDGEKILGLPRRFKGPGAGGESQ